MEGLGVCLLDNLIIINDYFVFMWFKLESFIDYIIVFFVGVSVNVWLSYVLLMVGLVLMCLWVNNGVFFDNVELDSCILVKEWIYVVFIVDGMNGDVLKMYVNGEL